VKLADPLWLAAKAGVASALAVVTARGLDVDDALSAGFVALACVSPSVWAGIKNGLEQLVGSALACAIAGLPMALFPAVRGSSAAILASLTLSVWACFAARLGSAYLVAGFSALYLHLLPFSSAALGISIRIEAVAIGILAATAVNTLVSSLFAERVAARRVTLAKRIVAGDLDGAARWLDDAREATPPTFHDAFQVVGELRLDLGAATHERLFPGAARARKSAHRGLALADALEKTAHLAKELVLVARAEGHGRSPAVAAEALREVARSLAGEAVEPALASDADPTIGDLVRRLRSTAVGAL
jgi:hypothetical protein